MSARKTKLRPSRCSGCGTTALDRQLDWVLDIDTSVLYWACRACHARGIRFWREVGKGFTAVSFTSPTTEEDEG